MMRPNPMSSPRQRGSGFALIPAFAGMTLISFLLSAAALADVPLTPQQKILAQAGITQKLGTALPADLMFRNESGEPVKLGDYLGRKPVILTFVYYECPMLCTLVLNGVVRALRAMPFTAGKEFDVVTVSFDPRETPRLAAEKKKIYLEEYKRPEAADGWHFLTGDEASIRALADAAGFRYRWDEESKQFAHAAGIMVATPQGVLSHYFYGIEYAPKDLRLAIVEASQGKIGSLADQILLFCFHYDPATGKYGFAIMNVLRLSGLATILAFGIFVTVSLKREHAERQKERALGK